MNSIEIVEYDDKYYNDFKKISYEWLKKYDLLEDEDEKIINNPKGIILDNGGFVFFAKRGEELIGTASLIKVDAHTFELAKLAVTEKYQGLKISNILMNKCLDVAKQNNATKIILYSNKLLTSALKLYEKFNFKEIPLTNNKYVESDIKMELQL